MKVELEIDIEQIGARGDGIATLEDGRRLYVPFTVPGDRVRARLGKPRPDGFAASARFFHHGIGNTLRGRGAARRSAGISGAAAGARSSIFPPSTIAAGSSICSAKRSRVRVWWLVRSAT